MIVLTSVVSAQTSTSGRLLVLLRDASALAIVDPVSGTVLERIPTGRDPHEVTASADGRFAFVASMVDGISVIDLEAGQEIRRVDPGPGSTQLDIIQLFNDDPDTRGIIMIGEIGGSAEEEAAAWVKENCRKPVAGFIAGTTAPPGRRMGHAGAIISGGKGTAEAKITAMKDAGISVAETPSQMAEALIKIL